MQGLGAPQQVHRGDQAYKSIKMIPMQMADKNVFDTLKMNMHAPERYLGTFATINQKQFFAMAKQLRRRIAVRSRCGRTAAKNGEVKGKHFRCMMLDVGCGNSDFGFWGQLK